MGHKTTDTVIVVVCALIFLSTVQGLGGDRSAVSSSSAIDSLAAFKMGVRLVAGVIAAWLLLRYRRLARPVFLGPSGWFLAFFAVAGLTAFESANAFVSASRAISFAVILLFALAAGIHFSLDGRERQFWTGFYGIFLSTSIPLMGLATWVRPVLERGELFARLGGPFHPNQLGLMAGLVLIISLLCLRRFVLVLIAAPVIPFAVYVSWQAVSRGSWIATAVGLGAVVAISPRVRRWVPIAVGLVAVVGLLSQELGFVDLEGFILDRVRRGQTGEELLTGTGRTTIYSYLLHRQFPQRPILGFGFQMLSDEDATSADPQQPTSIERDLGWHVVQAHNVFLSVLIGTGILGLTIFMIALALLVHHTWQAFRHGDAIAGDGLALLSLVVAHAMIDTTLITGVDHAFLTLSAIIGVDGARCAMHAQEDVLPQSGRILSSAPYRFARMS